MFTAPEVGCGHLASLRQQCGRCRRWCCMECYSPWMALTCSDCRAATGSTLVDLTDDRHDDVMEPDTVFLANPTEPPLAGRGGSRPDGRRPHGNVPTQDRFVVDERRIPRRPGKRPSNGIWSERRLIRSAVRVLEARMAELERRLGELDNPRL